MIPRWNKRPGSGVLALALARDRLVAVELRRTNGHAEIGASTDVPFTTNLFAANPETAARELRQALDAVGIKERRCAVALPPDLVLALSVDVPDLPEADRAAFLQMEGERGFPQAPEDLLVQTSVGTHPPGAGHATLLGVPLDSLARLEATLRAARLHPISFTLATTALQPPAAAESAGVLALLPTADGLALQLTHEGAIAALRVIDGAFVTGTEGPVFQTDHVLRELRITLGQLPPPIRDNVRRIRVFGGSEEARAVAGTLSPRLAALGIQVELVKELRMEDLPFRLPSGAPASAPLAVAARAAATQGRLPEFEFLPPRVSAWEQFSRRYASRRLAWAGAAAAIAVGLVLLTFLGQQWLIWHWQGRWDAIKARVGKLESMQKEIRLYRPWFDDSFRSLGILRRLTESFPEDGSVTAKSVEIRASGRVVCSGSARDTQAWLRMLDQMRNARGITDVQVEQVRGKSPLEFTFNFRWQGPGGS